MLGVNVAAFAVVGYFGARLAESFGRHPAWGLLFAAYPGFLYTLSLDLAELVEAAGVLAGLVALRERRYGLAALALSAAVLGRETAIILPVGIGAAWLWSFLRATTTDERPRLAAALPAVVPAVVAVVWQLLVGARFGVLPIRESGDSNLRYPFGGLLEVRDRFVPTSLENASRLLSLALLVVIGVLAFMAWCRTRADLGIRIGWALATTMLLVISEHVDHGATSFMRAGVESALLGLTLILGADLAVRRVQMLVTGVGGISLMTLASQIIKS
jgi:hypothetical protein